MHKNRIILIFCFIIASSYVFSQNWSKISVYQSDAENFMFNKQFDKAAETFMKALKLHPENANLKFKIGYCFLLSDDKKKDAIKYLEEAAESVSADYKEKSLKEVKAPAKKSELSQIASSSLSSGFER